MSDGSPNPIQPVNIQILCLRCWHKGATWTAVIDHGEVIEVAPCGRYGYSPTSGENDHPAATKLNFGKGAA